MLIKPCMTFCLQVACQKVLEFIVERQTRYSGHACAALACDNVGRKRNGCHRAQENNGCRDSRFIIDLLLESGAEDAQLFSEHRSPQGKQIDQTLIETASSVNIGIANVNVAAVIATSLVSMSRRNRLIDWRLKPQSDYLTVSGASRTA